jgi:hypothetical protein
VRYSECFFEDGFFEVVFFVCVAAFFPERLPGVLFAADPS